ncbi:MAG TPA: TetR/AcrR family transcriptional regulator [Candidatus Acidoferrum sp.]|nr:TetR/AcrR family transcriptional regulator [Candidatus Acidoferrum sp.]
MAEDIAENGYHAVTIYTITPRAKCGRSRFYRIFSGKEEALDATLKAIQYEVEEVLLQATDPASALADLLTWVDEHRAKAICFLVWGVRHPETHEAAIARFVELSGLPEVQAQLVVGGVAWTVRRKLEGGGMASALCDELSRFVQPHYDRQL